MSPALKFSVTDWLAWMPGRATQAAWRAWANGEELPQSGPETAGSALPMMLRRRAGQLGQKAIGVALACSEVGSARYVFASRHGDLSRTAGILTAIAVGEAPSPAEFSMSVHHAFAGLLSIQTENRHGHTAIAAGADSFGSGFLEAASCIVDQPSIPVILVYYDAPLPEGYAAFPAHEVVSGPFAMAIQFGPALRHRDGIAFEAEPAMNAQGERHDLKEANALKFLRFLLTDATNTTASGERMNWRWSRNG